MKIKVLITSIALALPYAAVADDHDHHDHHDHGHHYGHYHGEYYGPHYYGYHPILPALSFTYVSGHHYSDHVYHESRSLEADVQSALKHHGYYYGPVDGDIGPGSRSAIRSYQADNGLAITGRINSSLIHSLGL